MASKVTSLLMIAAVMLAAGCGGGSGSKSQSTGSAGGHSAVSTQSGAVVPAKSGAFTTVTPAGFSAEATSAQYYATGPVVRNFVTTVVVVRQPVREGDLKTVVDKTVRAVGRVPGARLLSRPRSLSVDGEPAFALDYRVTSRGGARGALAQHVSLVLVGHGEWIYSLRGFASPLLDTAASNALGEMIRTWHWL